MGEWQGSSSRRAPLPPDWRRRRLLVFERDQWTCRTPGCGWHDASGRTLEADHAGQPDDHSIEHLVTRCGKGTPSNCHGAITSAAGNAAKQRRARPPEVHPGYVNQPKATP